MISILTERSLFPGDIVSWPPSSEEVIGTEHCWLVVGKTDEHLYVINIFNKQFTSMCIASNSSVTLVMRNS